MPALALQHPLLCTLKRHFKSAAAGIREHLLDFHTIVYKTGKHSINYGVHYSHDLRIKESPKAFRKRSSRYGLPNKANVRERVKWAEGGEKPPTHKGQDLV